MQQFDFTAPADVFIADRRYRKSPLRYLRFDTSADAVRHVIEYENADAVVVIETDGHRAERSEIRDLYLSEEFPLARNALRRRRLSPPPPPS